MKSLFTLLLITACAFVLAIGDPRAFERRDRIDDVSGGPYVIQRDKIGIPEYLTRIKDAKPLYPLSYRQGWTMEIDRAYHYYDLETAQYDLKHQGGHLVSLRDRIKP